MPASNRGTRHRWHAYCSTHGVHLTVEATTENELAGYKSIFYLVHGNTKCYTEIGRVEMF